MTGPDFRLPPTSPALLDDATKPYFLWWTDATVGQLKEHLRSPDPEERAYWMGALLREANSPEWPPVSQIRAGVPGNCRPPPRSFLSFLASG
jgi:hypothetical protein